MVAKPRLRGVSHQWACLAFAAIGVALVVAAPAGRATVAASVYAASVVALFGTSALYRRSRCSCSTGRWRP
jgi:hemolysin III